MSYSQRYGTTVLREMWCHYGGQGAEFNEFGISCEPPYAWASPTFYGKPIGGVPLVAVDPFYALERTLKSEGYQAVSVWAYNSRPIASSGKPSLHGYGIAIDIDPSENPQANVPPYSGKFTEAQVEAVMGIRLKNGNRPWWWGGFWSGMTTPDLMHWQLDCTPAEALQIDWTTVPGGDDELAHLSDEAQKYLQAVYESLKTDPDKPNEGDTNPPGPSIFSKLSSIWRHSVKKTGTSDESAIVARYLKDTGTALPATLPEGKLEHQHKGTKTGGVA